MKLCLVRHGQCEWQLTRSGDLDSQLTPVGRRQAAMTAAWLTRQPELSRSVRAVVTSPLKRAVDTAEYIGRAIGVQVVVEDALAEAKFRLSEEAPSSEKYIAFRGQVGDALEQLRRRGANNNEVLAVAHGGVIKTLLRLMAQSELLTCEVGNASVSVFEWKEPRWSLRCLNSQEHLPHELRTT
jgi:broad specificity phosphatase PhoE